MKVNLMVWQLTSECIVGEIFPTVSVCQGPIFIYLRRSHTQIKCHISFAQPTLLWCKDLPKCEPWRPLGLIKGSLKRAGKAHWLFRERQMLCGWMSLNLLFWMNFRRSDQSINHRWFWLCCDRKEMQRSALKGTCSPETLTLTGGALLA